MTAALALLLVIVIWASNSILVKVVLREISPLTLTWLRFLLAGLFYAPYAVATWRRTPGYSRREWGLVVGAGIALVPVFSLTLYWALTYTSVANTALVRMTEPAWVLLLGAMVLGERATRQQVAGLALALLGTGALVLLGRAPSTSGEHHVLGMGFMVANSLAWVGYILCFKHLLFRHRVTVVTVHAALAGTAVLFLVTGPTHGASVAREAAAMSGTAWALVVTMAIVVTIGSNQLFSYGLQRLPAGVAAAYSYLTPVLSAVLAWLFLGEPITAAVVVCGAVIAAGVYLLNRA
ncbi:MAG TPA: DMT family transporter [Candidatus Bathyarchaeia archaeon]|nr:DMT family transporter [Candidatus Bathyarchaeia archaeon]